MSTLKNSVDLLRRYMIARIPFIALNTIERSRVLKKLQEIGEELGLAIYVHSLSRGVYDIQSNKSLNEDKSIYGAIDFIGEQMRQRQNLTMIFTETPDLSMDNDDARQILDLVNLANDTGGAIIAFSSSSIWNRLQRAGMTVKISLPDEEEMYPIIKEYIDAYRNDIAIEWDEGDIREAASILTGVTAIEAENVIASLIAKKEITKADMAEIYQAKNQLFSDISGLERIEVDAAASEVGGLNGLRQWLDEKRVLFTLEKREELKAKGLKAPRGILLVGVPGCGKSISAKSISANWHLPLYRLDFATVQGSYVGQSEHQLREALATAENVSPCILWIDEIEKGLSGATSSNDGGVSTRMVGQFLFWLQECKKQVFVVATANDISRLPSELLRRGRFDELFFIDLPTEQERREILFLYMKKYLEVNFTGEFSDTIVQMSEGFTGADLEATVRDLAYRKIANPQFSLNVKNIMDAFKNVVPLSQTSPETIEAIRAWGRERAVPASGRPIGHELPKNTEPRTRKVLI